MIQLYLVCTHNSEILSFFLTFVFDWRNRFYLHGTTRILFCSKYDSTLFTEHNSLSQQSFRQLRRACLSEGSGSLRWDLHRTSRWYLYCTVSTVPTFVPSDQPQLPTFLVSNSHLTHVSELLPPVPLAQCSAFLDNFVLNSSTLWELICTRYTDGPGACMSSRSLILFTCTPIFSIAISQIFRLTYELLYTKARRTNQSYHAAYIEDNVSQDP